MHSRPLISLSRILFVSCAIGLGTTSLLGQNPTSAPPKPAAPADAPASRYDIFAGYSYLAPHGTVSVPGAGPGGTNQSVQYKSVNLGAIGSVAYYFNRYVGGQVEYANHPDGPNDGFQTIQGGLIARYPTTEMTPFVHALAGGVRAGGPLHQPYTWGPAITVGGGLDYALPIMGGRIGLRLFQADYEYFHVNFGPAPVGPPNYIFGGRANINNARLSTGLLIHMGSITPPPPVTYSCSASPSAVFPGDPITVTGSALNLNPKKTPKYTWTTTGGTVTGDTATANVTTANLAPGSYTVKGNVTEGPKAGQFADCSAPFTVKPFEPPTISCSANPSTIMPGQSSTITAVASSPQNRPLTYAYSASAGSISGSGTTATETTAGAPAGVITITCDVTDDKGGHASATTTVTVEAPPPPPPPPAATKALCAINFGRDVKRPARVDNEAKGCLDDVALALQQDSKATAVVVGSSDPSEAPKKKSKAAPLAQQRAVNTKAYLVTEKGIDASRVSVRTGDAGTKEVKNYLVPDGASFDKDVTGTTSFDESTVKAQARTPLAQKKGKKAAK